MTNEKYPKLKVIIPIIAALIISIPAYYALAGDTEQPTPEQPTPEQPTPLSREESELENTDDSKSIPEPISCQQNEKLENGVCIVDEETINEDSPIVLETNELPLYKGWSNVNNPLNKQESKVRYTVFDTNTLEIEYNLKGAIPLHQYSYSLFIFHDGPEDCIDKFGDYFTECIEKSIHPITKWITGLSLGENGVNSLMTDEKGDGVKTIQIENVEPGTYEMAFQLNYPVGNLGLQTAFNTEKVYGIGEKITFELPTQQPEIPKQSDIEQTSQIDTQFFGPISYFSFESNAPKEFRDLRDKDRLTVVGLENEVYDSSEVELRHTSYVTQEHDRTDSIGTRKDGMSFYSLNELPMFTFVPNALGDYPTHVGIVFTDFLCGVTGSQTNLSLIASDPIKGPLEKIGPVLVGESGDTDGNTAEDRFFGVINTEGISKIEFKSESSSCGAGRNQGIEFDHLQYGR